jgi:hypothetical protein
MNRGNLFWRILLFGVVVLAGYAALFGWIGHRRVVKGPWMVTFASPAGTPSLAIEQPTLGIHDVRIVFPEARAATNAPERIAFSQARPVPFDVPFGRCVFLDPLFLPGTVVLDIEGHQIQILPRVLTIDRVEHPWRNGETIELRKSPPSAGTRAADKKGAVNGAP